VSSLRETLQAKFENGEVLQRPGRGGGPAQDYIEDETVMDRLDDAVGVGGWQLLVEPISLADGVVKVRLGLKVTDEWVWYEDFGYANNPQNDGLKEAVTDGIRRCGRMPGVARYLYHKHASTSGTGRAPSSTRPAAAPPPRTSTSVPDEPEFPDDFGEPTPIRPKGNDNNECPIHGVTWNGEWGDLWHKDEDGKYCRHPENTRGPARARGR
jgi:hypothetical protein